MQKQNALDFINWKQVVTSLVIGGVIGIYGFVRLSDSQQVSISAQGREIEELKDVVVPRTEYEQTIIRIDQRLGSIERSHELTNAKIDRLLERTK